MITSVGYLIAGVVSSRFSTTFFAIVLTIILKLCWYSYVKCKPGVTPIGMCCNYMFYAVGWIIGKIAEDQLDLLVQDAGLNKYL
jgi:hypothetical protein